MPTPTPICLDNLVGVTDKTDLPYFEDLTDELKEAIAASSSGLFLDTLTGGIDLYGIDDTDYMTAALKMGVNACKEASKVLNDELLLALNNRYQPAKRKFNGFIGQRSVSNTSNSSGKIQGHRYRMIEPIAGYITITSIGVQVNGVATFNVYIARCDARNRAVEEILFTFPVTTVIGVFTDVDMSSAANGCKLPMEIEGLPQEYYIYWDRVEAGGLFPKNNEIKCLTCPNQKTFALSEYMQFNGVSLADTTKLYNINADLFGHGISVAAVVGCDHKTVVCREYNKKEAVALMMQKAVQFKAGELWVEYILKSAYINRDNMQNREYLWGKRNNFRKEFEERITAIANNMQLGETHCYTCSENTMQKGTIYS